MNIASLSPIYDLQRLGVDELLREVPYLLIDPQEYKSTYSQALDAVRNLIALTS